MDKNKWKEKMLCPVCSEYTLQYESDICRVCFWENDAVQYENPDFFGGANILSLNAYKKSWKCLEILMPKLIEKYDIKQSSEALWKYGRLMVSRDNVKDFVEDLTRHNVEVELELANCDKFFDFPDFLRVLCKSKDLEKNKDEILEIIFAEDPIKLCQTYGLDDIVKMLKKVKDVKMFWNSLVPCISVSSNPRILPKLADSEI